MKSKFFSKAVIYLLITTIALPMWFFSGLFAQHAKAWNDEIIVDNTDAGFGYSTIGGWSTYSSASGYNGSYDYETDSTTAKTAKWTPTVKKPSMTAGNYQVYAHWSVHRDRPTNVEYKIKDSNGVFDAKNINQRKKADQTTSGTFIASGWALLGTYYFNASVPGYVELTEVASGDTCADAIKFTHNNQQAAPPILVEPMSGVFVGGADVRFDWEDVVDPDGDTINYELEIDNNSDFSSPEKSYSLPSASEKLVNSADIVPGVEYWRVKTNDTLSSGSRNIIKDTSGPNKPVINSALQAGNRVDIDWSMVDDNPAAPLASGLAGYNVYRDGNISPLNGPTLVTGTSYSDTSIMAGGNYSYKVEAVDNVGNKSVQSDEKSVDVDLTGPIAPEIVSVTGNGKTINLSWNAVSGAVGYYVYTMKAGGSWVRQSEMTTETSATINVSDYGIYYIRVTAVDFFGNESGESDSVAKQKSITLSTPTPVVKAVAGPVVAPVTVAPESAVAEEPANKSTGLDEQGKILGDENADTEEEDINWTPWIILFILIVLAGAATGGYFYWFSGEEEIEEAVEVKEKKSTPKSSPKKQASSPKKPRRW